MNDTEILDWIEKNPGRVCASSEHGLPYHWRFKIRNQQAKTMEWNDREYPSIREMVDAAIKAGQ